MSFLNLLCCPICKTNLNLKKNSLSCKNCGEKFLVKNKLVKMLVGISKDEEFSIKKWDRIYKQQLKTGSYRKDYEFEQRVYLKDTLRQIFDAKKIKNTIYLEIGCGPFFVGPHIAKKCKLIIGIDYSENALKVAEKILEKYKVKNYLLIQADILKIPIKENKVDLVYGGGVIEHFKDTEVCIRELFRILKKGGISFNTVPYLNIGSLTYR